MDAANPPEASLSAGSIPRLARGVRLQWEPVPQLWVLLYPEGRVELNPSAAEIMRRVDGAHSIAAIAGELQQAFDEADLGGDVLAALELAREQGWVQVD